MRHRGCGEAGEQRVDEHHAAVGHDRHVVDVEIARGPGELRHVEAIVTLMRLAGRQHVVEPPELVERREIELAAVRAEAHGPVEGALEDGEAAVGLEAEQEELAGLIGGEGQGQPLLGHPGGELARGRDLEARFARRLAGCSGLAHLGDRRPLLPPIAGRRTGILALR